MFVAKIFYCPILISVLGVITSVVYSEISYIFPFFTVILLSCLLIFLFNKIESRINMHLDEKNLKHSSFVVLAWLVIICLFSIPFVFTGIYYGETLPEFKNYINCLFETVSGITTTGLTIVNNEENLTKSVQIWRSLIQWFGGLGIFYFITIFLSDEDLLKRNEKLVLQETHLIYSEEDYFKNFIKKTIALYLLFTLVLMALLYHSGLDLWSSINYSLTLISTGGFGIDSDSVTSFGVNTKFLFILAIILSSSPLIRLNSSRQRIIELLSYLLLIFLVAFTSFMLFGNDYSKLDLIFQTVTSIGTAGFFTLDNTLFSDFQFFFFSFLMIIGGCSGSTAGGIKIRRLYSYLKQTWYILSNNHKKIDKTKEAKWYFLIAWISIVLISSIVLKFLLGLSFSKIFFEVNSALSCVGLSSGLVSAELPMIAQLIFIFLMLIGRLELVSSLFKIELCYSKKK